MNIRSLFLLLSACVLFTVLSGCSDGSVTSPAPPTETPTPSVTRIVQLNGNLGFGNVPVGSTMTTTITISNAGNAVLTVSGISAVGGLNAVLQMSWSNGTILPNASQQVTIQFTPATAQAYSGSLVVLTDATSGTNTMPVSGTGTSDSSAPTFYVFGGPDYAQFLGLFRCIFCTDFDADSINNQNGMYGNRVSSTSMRNEFSQYGSPVSNSSACNPFATNPPRVFNVSRTDYYGELTLNTSRPDAIDDPAVVNWLANNVCKR